MAMKTHNFYQDLHPNHFPGAINVWIGLSQRGGGRLLDIACAQVIPRVSCVDSCLFVVIDGIGGWMTTSQLNLFNRAGLQPVAFNLYLCDHRHQTWGCS